MKRIIYGSILESDRGAALYLKVLRMLSGEVTDLKEKVVMTKSRQGVSQAKVIASAKGLGKKCKGEERDQHI